MTEPLTREQIDQVVDTLTMGDVQEAFSAGVADKAIAGVAFTRAAKRLKITNGADPLDLVSLRDVGYVAERIKLAMADTNPKSPGTEG